MRAASRAHGTRSKLRAGKAGASSRTPRKCRLIHHAPQILYCLTREGVARLNPQRFLETFSGAREHAFGRVCPAEIEMWKMPRLVARSGNRAFQPGNRFVEFAELD